VNPKWHEIIEAIHDTSPTATSGNRADILARVFKLKLDELMYDLMHTQLVGRPAGISMVIEFQKRNLPRGYSVLVIHHGDRQKTADDIDKLVSAQIPREPTDADNAEKTECLIWARTAVLTYMVHVSCGAKNTSKFLAKAVKDAS
jgi:hypothetical protein